MTGKDKLQLALAHKEGPIPLDIGATAVTGMHCTVVQAMREYFELENRPVKVHDPYQMLGLIEDDLMDVLGIDVIGIIPRNTMFGFPIEAWKEWNTPWNQTVLVPGGFTVDQNGKGVYIYPQGDVHAPPSGHMPWGSWYFDAVIRQPSINEDELDPRDNLEEYTDVSNEELAYYRRACEQAEKRGKGIVINIGWTSLGDISQIPGPALKHPKGIRDITEWYISTVTRQDYIHEMFVRQTETALRNLKKLHASVGNIPDAVYVCGTDFGTQVSQFCSRETFENLYAPYYRTINRWIHEHTSWKTFKHSCGAIFPLLDSLIAAGFDILNPVQCSAEGMDPELLKDTYGKDLVFWGGAADTQQTLPFGTLDEVRTETKKRLEIFSRDGGYVFNTVHNVQAGTPVENLSAMLDELRKFNEGR